MFVTLELNLAGGLLLERFSINHASSEAILSTPGMLVVEGLIVASPVIDKMELIVPMKGAKRFLWAL